MRNTIIICIACLYNSFTAYYSVSDPCRLALQPPRPLHRALRHVTLVRRASVKKLTRQMRRKMTNAVEYEAGRKLPF